MNKRLLAGVVGMVVLALVVIGYYVVIPMLNNKQAVTNFEQCAATGQPVLESYPRQCNYNGQHFVEDISPTVIQEAN